MATGSLLVFSRGATGQLLLPSAECGLGDRAHRALRRRIAGDARPRTRSVNLQSGFLGLPEQQDRLRNRSAGRRGGAGAGAVPGLRRGCCKTRAGLPVVSSVPILGPLLNAALNPVALFIIYAAGASRFWGGFRRTTYSDAAATKLALTALWPALFVVSATYRSNFKRAIQ